MKTQDALTRAKTLLQDAKKPVRIFLGYCRDKRSGERRLSAIEIKSRLLTSLPYAELIAAPDTDPTELASAIEAAWQRIRCEQIDRKAKPTSTPPRRHAWRRINIRSAMA